MESVGSSGNISSAGQCDSISLSRSGTSIAVTLCFGVLIPPIVLGNGLVVIAFIINSKLRTATNIFICGLGLSDLLIGMFSVPYWTYISSLDSLMDAYCTPSLYKVYICIDIWTGCASIIQLTAIAIERLYFTTAPLKHRRLPRSVYWYMIGIAWFYSTFMAVLQPLQTNWQKEYSVFLMITCFVFPLFIIVTVYLYILKIGRRQAKKRPSSRARVGSTGGDFKEFNVFITVIVITGVFVIAWTPFFVVTVVASLCNTCISHPEHDPLVRFVKWMQYSSSAINPYIYAYRNEEVRSTFKKILRLCFCGFGSKKEFEKQAKIVRNSHRPSVEQRAGKPEGDGIGNNYNSGSKYSQSRSVRQHYPRMINVDDLIGLTPSSRNNALRDDSKQSELNVKEENARPPIVRFHDTPKKSAGYYDNKGFVGKQPSTKGSTKRHEDKNSFKGKGNENKAYLEDYKTETRLDSQQNNKYSHSNKYKRRSNLTEDIRRLTNQNNDHKSRDAQINHISTYEETSIKSANQSRVHKSRDNKTATYKMPQTDHNRTCPENERSSKSTNQKRVQRSRDKETRADNEVSYV